MQQASSLPVGFSLDFWFWLLLLWPFVDLFACFAFSCLRRGFVWASCGSLLLSSPCGRCEHLLSEPDLSFVLAPFVHLLANHRGRLPLCSISAVLSPRTLSLCWSLDFLFSVGVGVSEGACDVSPIRKPSDLSLFDRGTSPRPAAKKKLLALRTPVRHVSHDSISCHFGTGSFDSTLGFPGERAPWWLLQTLFCQHWVCLYQP